MPNKPDRREASRDPPDKETRDRPGSPGKEYAAARRLGTLAILLSILAIVLAFITPGLLAPRTVIAQNSISGTTTIGAACTHYVKAGARAEVTISAPRAGTIVVTATVNVGINHTKGISDTAIIVVAASATDCTATNHAAFVSIPFSLETDPYHYETVPITRPFQVGGAATMTFYVNGVMSLGGDAGDRFDSASLVAVFYPA